MTLIDPHTLLSDLVTARPDLMPVLESLELDYCCGGARTLAAACTGRGLGVDEVMARLDEQVPAEPENWTVMSAPELVDHLERTHHAYLREALPRLTELMDRVVAAHGDKHAELSEVSSTLAALRADMEPHLMKEERVLFPMIRELYSSAAVPEFHCGSIQNPIAVMGVEHDRVGELLARLRTLTSVYTPPSDGCATYEALYAGLAELESDTHGHVHKENNVLFPAVVAEELRRGGGR
jgi:regulator of cell morphogenesis and NO signaling